MRRAVAAGFAGLCLLGGSTWLPAEYVASAWPELLRLCVHDLVVCAALAGFALVRRVPAPCGWRLEEMAAWGAVLFAVPPVLFAAAAADGRLSGSMGVLILWLVPLFTVFTEGQRDERAMRMLTPAVLAVGGLSLLVPALAWPGSIVGVIWLAAMLVAAGLVAAAGIRLHGLLREESLAWAGAAVCGASAFVAGIASGVIEHGALWNLRAIGTEILWGLSIDLPLVLLTLWVLRKLPPVAASSRFVWVPLVTIVGGMLAMRPQIGWQMGVGLVVALGASWMLASGASE